MLKPRVRVSAGDATGSSVRPAPGRTLDSFVNFAARVGVGAGNLSDGSGYNFNFLTHQRTGLEAAYRGSWIIGAAIDNPAEDMTTAGIALETPFEPDQIQAIDEELEELRIAESLTSTIKWGSLYGGAVAVIVIAGQDLATPLNIEAVGKGAFRGLMVFDRWMLNPPVGELVTEPGPDFGFPKWYQVIQSQDQNVTQNGQKIHYSRCIRIDGIELPYQQRLVENNWSMSIVERIFDRVQAFDSTTMGAAQLVYKAHLKFWKIPKLRELIAAGGPMLDGVVKQIEFVRAYASNEGFITIDAEDEVEAMDYTFTGLDDVLLQLGQQLAGAIDQPMVRLYGQSPAGLNSSGESDLRTYYDGVKRRQVRKLKNGWRKLIQIASLSKLGKPYVGTFSFVDLWQLRAPEKAEIAEALTRSVVGAFDSGIVRRDTALGELKQSAKITGVWSNITQQEIKDAEADPPPGEVDAQRLEAETAPEPEPGAPPANDRKEAA